MAFELYEALKQDPCEAFPLVQKLLDDGVEVNVESSEIVWETPLHKAAEKHSPEIVKLLLDSGALIDALSGGTISPLLLAVTHGQFQNCNFLLERGANPNLLSHNGTTHYIIFELAVKNQHPAIVEMLFENGVSINA